MSTLDRRDKLTRWPLHAVSIALPAPIDLRLDQLFDAVRDEGHPTSRREIVAALIFACQLSGPALIELLNGYRQADLDTLLPGTDLAAVLVSRRPGRPRLSPHDRPRAPRRSRRE